MRKISSFIIILLVLVMVGCNEELPDPYTYIEFQGREFVKIEDGVYKSKDGDYVYFDNIENEQIVTMTFSDVKIKIMNSNFALVVYPDGCTNYSIDFDENGLVDHEHDYSSYLQLTQEKINNSKAEKLELRSSLKDYLVVFIILSCYFGIFVFFPKNVRRFKKFSNSILPMHEKPYEPSDLYICLTYISYLIVFIICVFSIIGILLEIY